MTPTTFHQHLANAGGVSRQNPELARLSRLTGYSVEHLFKVATGTRPATEKCKKAVLVHTKGALGPESFPARTNGNGHGGSVAAAGDGVGAS